MIVSFRFFYLGSFACVQLLVEWEAELNAKNALGRTPLMIACDKRETKKTLRIVRHLLLSKMIDINTRDLTGNSAGILATKKSNVWIMRELLMSGISVNAKGKLLQSNSTGKNIIEEFSSVLDVSRGIISFTSIISNDNTDISSDKSVSSSDSSDDGNSNKIRFSNSIETGEKSKSKKGANLLDGIQYESPSILFAESLWRKLADLCYLMIVRKSREEKLNQEIERNRLNGFKKIHVGSVNKDIDNILHKTITNYSKRTLKNQTAAKSKCDELSLQLPIEEADEIPSPSKFVRSMSSGLLNIFTNGNVDTVK